MKKHRAKLQATKIFANEILAKDFVFSVVLGRTRLHSKIHARWNIGESQALGPER